MSINQSYLNCSICMSSEQIASRMGSNTIWTIMLVHRERSDRYRINRTNHADSVECKKQTNKRTNKQVKGIRLDQSGTTRNSKYKNEDCGGKFWVAACGQALETEISWIGWFASDNYASTRPVSSQTKHSTVNSMVLCNLTVWLFQGSDC